MGTRSGFMYFGTLCNICTLPGPAYGAIYKNCGEAVESPSEWHDHWLLSWRLPCSPSARPPSPCRNKKTLMDRGDFTNVRRSHWQMARKGPFQGAERALRSRTCSPPVPAARPGRLEQRPYWLLYAHLYLPLHSLQPLRSAPSDWSAGSSECQGVICSPVLVANTP